MILWFLLKAKLSHKSRLYRIYGSSTRLFNLENRVITLYTVEIKW